MSLEVPNLLNSLKASADTPDAEFDGSISPFTAVDGSSGTASLLAGSGAGLYDVASRTGWVLFQVGTSSGDGVALKQDYTLPDGKCIVAPIAYAADQAADVSNNELLIGIGVNDNDSGIYSGATGQTLHAIVDTQAGSARAIGLEGSGDPLGTSPGAPMSVGDGTGLTFLRIDRSGLNYDCFFSKDGYAWSYLGRKTMSTAANNVWLWASCEATMANRVVVGCPWFREGTALAVDPFPL